jgi:phospholipid/cholesterol/gamma-HCH transport system substrate-binding protein
VTNSLVETLIGAIVIAIAGVFVFYAYSTAGMPAKSGYELTALFNRVDGITPGSDVRIAGIKVGTVTSLSLDTKRFQARLALNIASVYQVPDDSQVRVATEGLLGSSYLAIQPGGSDVYLQPGGEIEFTQGTIDVFSLISQAIFSMGGKKDLSGAPAAEEPATTPP